MTVNPPLPVLALGPFIAGDDPLVSFSVKRRNGSVVNLTDKRVEVVVKADPDDTDANALYTLSSEGVSPAVIITDAPNGLGTFDLSGRCDAAGTTHFRAYVADVADATAGRRTFARGRIPVDAA